jgi:hypothetical protein
MMEQLARYSAGASVAPIEDIAVVKRDVAIPILHTPIYTEKVEKKSITCMRRLLSIRLLLPVLSLISIVIIVILVWAIGYTNNQRSIADVAAQLQNDVSLRIFEKTTTAMDLPGLLNDVVYNQVSTGKLDLIMDDVRIFMTGAFFSATSIYSLYVGTIYDEFSALTRYSLGDNSVLTYAERNRSSSWTTEKYISNITADVTDNILSEFDYYPTSRAWFQVGNGTKAAGWTDIYFDAFSGVAVITAEKPYFYNGSLVAVMAVDYDITFLNSFLHSIQLTPNARTYIMQRNGLLIASSAGELVDKESNRVVAFDSSDPIIASTTRALNNTIGLAKLSSHNLIFNFGVNYVSDLIIWLLILLIVCTSFKLRECSVRLVDCSNHT